MARKRKPPRPNAGHQCRVPYCEAISIEKALFCAEHELLWVANSGTPSFDLKYKHTRRYKRFLRTQSAAKREWLKLTREQRPYLFMGRIVSYDQAKALGGFNATS